MGSIFVDSEKDVIEDFFYITQDSISDSWHFGDNLEDIKSNAISHYMDMPVQNEMSLKDIEEKIQNIKEEDLQKVSVYFSKPDLGTALKIIGESITFRAGEEIIDPEIYTVMRLVYLLKKCTVGAENLPILPESIRNIHPVLGQGIILKMNKNIPHYRRF